MRYNGDVISIWNRDGGNQDFEGKMTKKIVHLWDLPPFVNIEYKRHHQPPGGTQDTSASNSEKPGGISKPPFAWRRLVDARDA